MPTHDIIDNRQEKLVDHINRILASTEAARFAVGYFFLSGLESIAERLKGVKELRLLIGNTTNRETLEQLAEGYQRLELVREAAEAQAYSRRTETKRMANETAANIRAGIELMDQTDESEALVNILARMIEEKRLTVRVYTKGRMHAKAYIFDYGPIFDASGKPMARHEKGLAIVGSSNLTLSGVTHNTELNVIVQGNDNHAELARWFEALWHEAQDFDETLMHELQQSWAMAPVRPYDIYMKTLYTLVQDRLEGEEDKEVLWDDEIIRQLADFQKVAVRQAVQMIRQHRGAFVADVVGLGKSYIGAAIIKHFERTDHARPLVICPAPLVEMWERYNEVFQLNARVLSMGYLREEACALLEEYRERDFVLIDESHNLRHPDTQRYKLLQEFLHGDKHSCFLTATPRNKSAWDVYHQIKLFHQEDKTDLPVDPPDLKEYFKRIEAGEKKLPDLLYHLQIRRLRKHVLRWYGFAADTHLPLNEMSDEAVRPYLAESKRAYVIVAGKPRFFPKRELETIEYSIEETYLGLYQKLRGYLGRSRNGQPKRPRSNELCYARYGLWHYVVKDKQRQEPYASLQRAGKNLRGLMRVLLFKRFESSVHSFRETIRRLIGVHELFLAALQEGIVATGEAAQTALYEAGEIWSDDLFATLQEASQQYLVADFDLARLQNDVQHDLNLLQEILHLVAPITPQKDAKLQTLLARLALPPLCEGKRLIFTQYADTARYLFENLNPGGRRDDMDVIYSGDKSKARVVGRFAPKANPEYRFQSGESELFTVIATDVLAEGLNLQDCDKIINYDLHWNPVRLIQRFGRIDRIGSDHEVIYGFNFLPETGMDKHLKLQEKLHNRIQEIHDTIGEDSAILDRSEQLNEDAMFVIYEKNGGQLSSFEEDDDEIVDLNEAEQILRQLRKENPVEYERIANLRDGIRTAMPAKHQGLYVFCQAGNYRQLFLLDDKGEIVSRDLPRILAMIRCTPEAKAAKLPKDYNTLAMGVKRLFAEEVKHRHAEREHTLALTHGQRYVLRELRVLFGVTEDEEVKTRINLLERTFRQEVTSAVKRELNLLRRNGVAGQKLLKSLGEIYYRHNLQERLERRSPQYDDHPIPRIICSEGLV